MYQYSRTPTSKAAIEAQNEETQHVWALWATRAFLGVSVTISVMGAWGKGWVPGILFTITMAALVVLLSQTLGKAISYARARNWRLFVQTVVMGFIFMLVEANLNHIGLEAMNQAYQIAPSELLVPACIALSLVNIFGTDTYTSVPQVKPLRPKEVDLLIRSSRLPVEPDARHADRMRNWMSGKVDEEGISTIMSQVADRMKTRAAA